MFAIDRIAYKNKLRGTHPIEKLFFSLTSIVLVLLSADWRVPSLIFCIMTLTIVFFIGVRICLYAKLLMIPALFILMSAFTVLLKINAPEEGNFFTGHLFGAAIGADMTGITTGYTLFLKSFSSVSCFYFLVLSTPVSDFEYIFRVLRFPVFFREMFMLVYRYIFIVIGMSEKIYVSQKVRLGYVTLSRSFTSIGSLASGVLVNSLVFGKKSYEALCARGFEGELNVIAGSYHFSKRNWVFILILEIVFISLIVWQEQ